jgi:hypothetical protein
MNSSSHAAAEAAAHHIPAQLEPEVARKLLTTAVLRQHVSAVQHMAGLAVMQQHADAAVLQSCLQELIVPSSLVVVNSAWRDDLYSAWRYGLYSRETALQHQYGQLQRSVYVCAACAMPAAALLGTDAVTQLLLAGVRAGARIKVIIRLCKLPAAHQLSSCQATQILDVAIQRGTSCTAEVCSLLPAAQQLTTDALV